MRITVTVVVIMFELTGALTYILPTMIVLLVTKAVADYFGRGGIADQMIRLNGYPYLDAEEHEVDIPVSKVMRKDLYTLSSNGMTAHDVESLLDNATVQGFPIISPDRILLGYIERQELRYVLEKARRTRKILPHTLCSFAPPSGLEQESSRQGIHQSNGLMPTMASGAAMGIEEGEVVELIETTTSHNREELHLWPWVNQTPITVSPLMSLEIVTQLFKRMGPRSILVEQHGRLVGLVTVKDVLRYNASTNSSDSARVASDTSIWDSGALSQLLEDVWLWLQGVRDRGLEIGSNLLGR